MTKIDGVEAQEHGGCRAAIFAAGLLKDGGQEWPPYSWFGRHRE